MLTGGSTGSSLYGDSGHGLKLELFLKIESHYAPSSAGDYFPSLQKEVRPVNRREVADWMLEVCEDGGIHSQVFISALHFMDRFLRVCSISKSQLQLLGGVCLFLSSKVLDARPRLSIPRLIEYSDRNLSYRDIMDWEVLLLSKLKWDTFNVTATDFMIHILKRLSQLRPDVNPESIRRRVESLIIMCTSHHGSFYMSPSLLAGAAVLIAVRPFHHAVFEVVLEIISKDGDSLIRAVDKIDDLVKDSIGLAGSPNKSGGKREEDGDHATPTKVHDVVARRYSRN